MQVFVYLFCIICVIFDECMNIGDEWNRIGDERKPAGKSIKPAGKIKIMKKLTCNMY